MNSALKSKIPFLFLLYISIGWGFYYQSNNALNDYGQANFEWLFLFDAFVALPLVCFFCIKNKNEALLKSIVLGCLAVLAGSYIIPEQSKLIWHYLESGRYLVLAVMVLFELMAIMTVYLAIKTALDKKQDPDLSIEQPIKRYVGGGPLAKFLCFETRMWTYALFAKRVKPDAFSGEQHFSYHQKDGAQSNLLGFILLIAFEMPIVHVLLHFVWSPFAANVVTTLTLFSLVFFIAEYRAISKRPISLNGTSLVIRYGLYHALVVPLANIASVVHNKDPISRAQNVKRYNYTGSPNVKIELVQPIGCVDSVYIGVDRAEHFISQIKSKRNNL